MRIKCELVSKNILVFQSVKYLIRQSEIQSVGNYEDDGWIRTIEVWNPNIGFFVTVRQKIIMIWIWNVF